MIRLGLTFPGQGSQAPGMADGLLSLPLARRLLDQCAAEGVDLEGALTTGDADALRPTAIAQPALFLTEVVLHSLLPGGFEVLGAAGHSIGEYAALVAAGVLDPVAGMSVVIARGRAMAAMSEGTMAAVIGCEEAVVDEICHVVSRDHDSVVVVANLNSPGQVVISGTAAGVTAASEAARERGARRVLPLNVSGAFHSPLMAAASRDFAAVLDAAAFGDAVIPVVTNVDGEQSTRAEDIRHRVRRQLVSPVRWTDCVARLAGLGVDVLVEIGPGSVLTGLAKRIAPGVDAVSVSDPDSMAALADTLGARSR